MTSIKIRNVEFKNRIFVSPMCQYSSTDGMPNDWHLVHLGSRAVGGAGCVIAEATAVSPEGRISPDDLGIWDEKFINSFKRITAFIKSQGSIPGIQLAHAGRKASTYSPWKGNATLSKEDGAWQTLAPSAIPFSSNFPFPKEMTKEDINTLIKQFQDAAERSIRAGFEVVEIHMAHGYLIHQFLSPISNKRNDEYGGDLANRCRLALEVAKSVREIIPNGIPLFVRLSCTDWVQDGWDMEQTIQLTKWLKEIGVDLIDCSSGGNVADAQIPAGIGYQIPFAERIKKDVGILTGGLDFITSPEQAEQIITTNQADVVLVGREFLRDPYWPLHSAKVLNADIEWPKQYLRAK